ncbi:exported hypothetical protein [Candidatus Accumulibacter aalborgensis]|uniref:Cytochrome c domain-containing protein n=1 Tax=Candidatus Accumulibacter aalborgensis TaxID=1860102 RepID=A0A1A8XUU1_9PROT|nr:hypothetical protein [Candidatus Accumulibacter aalborgensis]SBT08337.1 exported hypothetical protein [Candidatus Accumulibacter aalborgensis]
MKTRLLSLHASSTTAKSGFAMLRTALTATVALTLLPLSTASATPYFATQTGQRCTYCHVQAPTNQNQQLNDTGIAFKANGYNLPQRQPVCTMQQMQLFDNNRVYRGVFPVQVCN